LTGKLLALDARGRHAVVRAGGKDHAIRFSELRYLAVAERPGAKPAEGPRVAQLLRMVFADGDVLQEKIAGLNVDQCGIHVFRAESTGRLFVPLSVVHEYSLSPTEWISGATPGGASAPAAVHEECEDALRDSAQLHEALERRQVNPSRPTLVWSHLGEALVRDKRITEAQLQQALATQQSQSGMKLGEVLEKLGFASETTVQHALARQLRIPVVRLQGFDIDPKVLGIVPDHVARKCLALPLCMHGGAVVFAMAVPEDIEAMEALAFAAGHPVEPAWAPRAEILRALDEFYGNDIDADLRFAAAEDRGGARADTDYAAIELERLGNEKPIVRLVNSVLIDAARRHSSDIHIRPMEGRVDLLFRIDGALQPIRSFNKALLPSVVSRIKILSRMNIAECRLPQDGHARIVDKGNVIDLRVSVIPTVYGESVVIRLLDTQVGLRSVAELGFTPQDEEAFRDLLAKSYGMVLITGPTGSGKTTTLYAALQELRKKGPNIVSTEDPVEYHIDGVEQIQVNNAAGLTFARALRHILRHDPDVVMVGEIRDAETAKIAVESALTGHLVLTSLHTNDAASAATRLIEMGVEPYLVSSTVLGVLAQRLVRRNCPHCLQPETPDPLAYKVLDIDPREVFFKGAGCEHCNHTGYHGRLAVYELMPMRPGLRTMIEAGASAEALHAEAVKNGMTALTQNALAAARLRKTSLAEVYRVRLE
jgi:type IV pilus assembly protein PilB